MTPFTLKQLQEKLDIPYPIAYGFIKLLEELDLAKDVGAVSMEGKKGKGARLYTIEAEFGSKLEKAVMEKLA